MSYLQRLLQNLKTCALDKNNLCGNLLSSLELHLMKDLKLVQDHFLFLIIIY